MSCLATGLQRFAPAYPACLSGHAAGHLFQHVQPTAFKQFQSLAVADVGNNSLDHIARVPGIFTKRTSHGNRSPRPSKCHHSKAGVPPLSASAIFSRPRSREVPEGCDKGLTSDVPLPTACRVRGRKLFGFGVHVHELQVSASNRRRLRSSVEQGVHGRAEQRRTPWHKMLREFVPGYATIPDRRRDRLSLARSHRFRIEQPPTLRFRIDRTGLAGKGKRIASTGSFATFSARVVR